LLDLLQRYSRGAGDIVEFVADSRERGERVILLDKLRVVLQPSAELIPRQDLNAEMTAGLMACRDRGRVVLHVSVVCGRRGNDELAQGRPEFQRLGDLRIDFRRREWRRRILTLALALHARE
jgi:hypothetical protein